MLNTIEQRIDKEFKGSALERLQLRTAVARAYEQRGHHESARVLVHRALEEAQAANLSDDLAFLKARVLGAHWLIFDEPSVMDLDRVIERLRSHGQDGVDALVEGLVWRVGVAYRFERRTGMTWDTLYADGREAFDLAGRHLKPVSGRQLHAAIHLAGHLLNLLDDTDSSRSLEDRSRESVGVLEVALANARADPEVGAGNLDLNLAEAVYGYVQCALGRPHDGMRRMLDSVATVRAHHTDDNYVIGLSTRSSTTVFTHWTRARRPSRICCSGTSWMKEAIPRSLPSPSTPTTSPGSCVPCNEPTNVSDGRK